MKKNISHSFDGTLSRKTANVGIFWFHAPNVRSSWLHNFCNFCKESLFTLHKLNKRPLTNIPRNVSWFLRVTLVNVRCDFYVITWAYANTISNVTSRHVRMFLFTVTNAFRLFTTSFSELFFCVSSGTDHQKAMAFNRDHTRDPINSQSCCCKQANVKIISADSNVTSISMV